MEAWITHISVTLQIIERLDTLNSLAAFEDEIDAVVMLANSIIDGDADRFGKSKIWR